MKSLLSQGVQAQMAKCSEASRHKSFSLSKGGGGIGGGPGSIVSQSGGRSRYTSRSFSSDTLTVESSSQNEHDPTNLYIANLPIHMTEHDLEAMLTMYGAVISTRILKDANGAPRGVGFAR